MLLTLLFFHLLAVVALFTGIGLELAALLRVWRATTLAEVRAACLNIPLVGPIMGIFSLLLIATGIAMVYVGGFGWSAPWIDVVFVIAIILSVAGPAITGRRADALHAMAARAGEGALTPEIDLARRDIALRYFPWLSLFELVAALYVMTLKPGLTVSVVSIVIAAVIAAMPVMLRRREAVPAEAKL